MAEGDLQGAKAQVLATMAKVMEQYLGATQGGIVMHDGTAVMMAGVPVDVEKTVSVTPSGGLLLAVGNQGEQNELLVQLAAALDRVRAAKETPDDA